MPPPSRPNKKAGRTTASRNGTAIAYSEVNRSHPMIQDPAATFPEIRESVRRLCTAFPGEYWRELDRERAYPTAYAQVTAGSIKALGVSSTKRSEEHTSELQSLMRISYAVFCLHTKQQKT